MANLGDVEQGLVGGGGGDECGREGGLRAGHRPRKLREFAQSLNIFGIFYTFYVLCISYMLVNAAV